MSSWKVEVVVAAIIQADDRFLLVEEVDEYKKIVVNQPAGHWEANESLFEAVKREVLEETAWSFQPEGVVGLYDYPNTPQQTYLRLCFHGKVLQHEPSRKLDEGILRVLWLTRDEIAQLPNWRSPLVLRCVDDYLAGARYPLDFVQRIFPVFSA